MNSELAAYDESIGARFAQIGDCLRGLDAAQLNWQLPIEGANSIWVLAEHIAGATHAWIVGIACGREVARDRPGEFASSGTDGSHLATVLDRAASETRASLRELDPSRLDVRLLPSQALWGEAPAYEISVREAIVRVIMHLSLHLGHMQVTRDLALAQK